MDKKELRKNLITQLPVPRALVSGRIKRTISSVKTGVVAAGIFIAVGLVLLLQTEEVYKWFPYTVGGFLLVVGGFEIFRGIKIKEYRTAETKLLANGIIYAILGAVVLYHRHGAEYIIGALWGVLGIIKGSEALNTVIHRMYLKTHYGRELFRAVAEILLGVLLLVDAKAALKHHVFILGIELLLVGWRILQDAKLLRRQENKA